ncbi:MAG: YfbK domain-containing protein [Oceanicaulis sp.]
MHIGVQGHDVAAEERPRATLVFLIDISGSMSSPDKLPLALQGFRMMLAKLGSEDTVAIAACALAQRSFDEEAVKRVVLVIDGDFNVGVTRDERLEEVRFSIAAAAYAQLLRGAAYLNGFTFEDAREIALGARGEDPFGCRAEFVQLLTPAESAAP